MMMIIMMMMIMIMIMMITIFEYCTYVPVGSALYYTIIPRTVYCLDVFFIIPTVASLKRYTWVAVKLSRASVCE